MDANERFVADLVQSKFGAVLRKIPEGATPTPDFEADFRGQPAFVAELKTLEATSQPKGWFVVAHPDGKHGAIPDINALSRVANRIHEAHEQLQGYPQPRVLIFLNDDPSVHVGHLDGVITGVELFTDGKHRTVVPCFESTFCKRVEEERTVIDLFLWINRHSGNTTYIKTTSDAGDNLAHRVFCNETTRMTHQIPPNRDS